MIHIEKIFIPHSDTCNKVKNPKKIGCAKLEIIESDVDLFRSNLQKERQIKGITFLRDERHFYINDNCIFI